MIDTVAWSVLYQCHEHVEAHPRWEWRDDLIVAMDTDVKIEEPLKLKSVLCISAQIKERSSIWEARQFSIATIHVKIRIPQILLIFPFMSGTNPAWCLLDHTWWFGIDNGRAAPGSWHVQGSQFVHSLLPLSLAKSLLSLQKSSN